MRFSLFGVVVIFTFVFAPSRISVTDSTFFRSRSESAADGMTSTPSGPHRTMFVAFPKAIAPSSSRMLFSVIANSFCRFSSCSRTNAAILGFPRSFGPSTSGFFEPE